MDALACIDAGASIVHNHVDDLRLDGADSASRYLAGWEPVLAKRPDALMYPTINLGPDGPGAHLVALAESGLVKLGILDPGSVNLGVVDDTGVPVGGVYANSFDQMRNLRDLHEQYALGPSLAIFEPGFLRAAQCYVRAGLMPRGAMAKLYFGAEPEHGSSGAMAPFGLPPTIAALDAYCELMDDAALPWSVSVVGGDLAAHRDFALEALARGAHLRVGLEDYAGPAQPRNVELVDTAVELCQAAGRPVADCAQTATILDLPRA